MDFNLISDMSPKGDQPAAIEQLRAGLDRQLTDQVLLGVTGSGKTFTMANVIAAVNRPTIVIAPNKTLAAQLYQEFKQLFPENAVEYFVSYYDYYQPEAYIPSSDTYIQKDSSINDMIDKMRHSATRSVLSRRDVVVVASVSCIFGLGAPEDYLGMRVDVASDLDFPRDKLLRDLVAMHYERNDIDFHRGTFRVRGDRVEIFPAYEESQSLRIDFFGDTIESIAQVDPLRGVTLRKLDKATIFPASHYVTSRQTLKRAVETIMAELKLRVEYFREEKKFIESQRVEERTRFDLEMIQELGYCNGIENYSRHLTGRRAGEPPPTLLDYFPDDYLMFIDESHIAIPQLRAMYRGDRSRKETLVNYGFRLPSALDNRPLTFEEWRQRVGQVIYVSATPAEYENEMARGAVVEQIVRPTGLVDPQIVIRPAQHQVDDLFGEIVQCKERNERVLITTLTKRMAEDLSEYYADLGIAVRYLHSDITTLERMEIIRELRMGKFDVLVGINLLREGLDIPEVSLVAILDADKEGFLRSARSLIQTFGRAARNVNGTVILYADKETDAMRQAIGETNRRRTIQSQYNVRHGIVPQSIRKGIGAGFDVACEGADTGAREVREAMAGYQSVEQLTETIEDLEKRMHAAAGELEFERAAELRDRIKLLKTKMMFES
ncbi:excinuclease ABC subunit UvrB [Desulfatitalea tepidiphila]|uniref:excinuclease ABC subunit UvrB n=1 Tax=Desulfatitalea tepidiphila TaxID=1185843 RepID=UPI0006B66D7B|nr:excinuclease ABC subunit UvrB [Desulfatitalea tepidiphila]